MRFIFCALVVFVTGLQSRAHNALYKEDISRLRPTQATVGQAAVNLKAKKLEGFSETELKDYLQKHPVPVVWVRNNQPYLIDHHHLSRALMALGHKSLYIQVVADWSSKTEKRFWNEMEKNGYTYLYDADGNRLQPSDLPKSIKGLVDDPYRSLAYLAREAGAFKKTSIPFAEFFWASYYRKLITSDELKDWERATETAKTLSLLPEAAGLPGYIGSRTCSGVFL